MTDCIAQLSLGFHPERPVEVAFDAPETSSDGGALLLRAMDDRLGLSARLAASLADDRAPARVRHGRLEQVRQRLYQIALGYEDCNDADALRRDPLLKTACDRLPDEEEGLSSQPTLSRFENAADGPALRRLLARLEEDYVAGLPEDAETVVLDIDSTDDPTHGAQQMTFFHGFYDQYMYHPLLVFDGERGDLIAAILRPGNAHAARGALGVLRRLIRGIKRRLPNCSVLVRGDSGFCVPRVLRGLERLDAEFGGVDYLFGIAKNPVLLRLAAPGMERAAALRREGREHVREFAALAYAAESWERGRRVILKAEHGERGPNPRFVVTTLEGFAPGLVYDAYCERGRCENRIKDFKRALASDRLSCPRLAANFFRLLLHAAAYRLMHALRTLAGEVSAELARLQFDTLRLKLLKVAATVSQSVRRILVRLPRAFPLAAPFREVLRRAGAPPGVPA